jgi:hypothetical protein
MVTHFCVVCGKTHIKKVKNRQTIDREKHQKIESELQRTIQLASTDKTQYFGSDKSDVDVVVGPRWVSKTKKQTMS